MKKEKWQQKLKNNLGALRKTVVGFYQSKRKLAIGLTAGVLVLVVLLGYVLGTSSSKSNGTSYTAVKVTRGTIIQTIDAVGNIEAVPSAVLNWKTSGVVGTVNVKIGDQVKEGDVLAALVDSSVDSSILTAQNDLLSAKLSLETLKPGTCSFKPPHSLWRKPSVPMTRSWLAGNGGSLLVYPMLPLMPPAKNIMKPNRHFGMHSRNMKSWHWRSSSLVPKLQL